MKTISIEMSEHRKELFGFWATMNGHCAVFFVRFFSVSQFILTYCICSRFYSDCFIIWFVFFFFQKNKFRSHHFFTWWKWLFIFDHVTELADWVPYSFQMFVCGFFSFHSWMMRFMSICLHSTANIHEKSNQLPSVIQFAIYFFCLSKSPKGKHFRRLHRNIGVNSINNQQRVSSPFNLHLCHIYFGNCWHWPILKIIATAIHCWMHPNIMDVAALVLDPVENHVPSFYGLKKQFGFLFLFLCWDILVNPSVWIRCLGYLCELS